MRRKYLTAILGMLFYTISVYADGTNWKCDPYAYQYDMTAYIDLQVDGEEVSDVSRYTIAAFYGDECRGVVEVKTIGNHSYGYLRIRSNKAEGERITFQVFDTQTEKIAKSDNTIDFKAQDAIGKPSSPLVIKAKNQYKITFIVDDSVIESLFYYGDIIEHPNVPAKEGYTFAGWQNVPDVMPAHDLEIIGSYTVNVYAIKYYVDGVEYHTASIAYGTAITPIAEPTKEGHKFSGWSDIPDSMPAGDVRVEGSFIVQKYRVTYIIDGTVLSTDSVAYGAKVVAPEAPAKEGHTFGGWQNVPETMPANDVEVTGSYTVNVYAIKYYVDGVEYHTASIAYGTAITPIAEPTKEGHKFSGWSEVPETMPARVVRVEGCFIVQKYKVTYTIDGTVLSTDSVAYGAKVVAPEAPAKEGHTFGGWQNVPETMPANDVEVTGSYTVNSYTLVFRIGDEVILESVVEYGDTLSAPVAPAKEGHTFAGWSEYPATMPASDLTVEGSYTINSYTLVFRIGDEVILESVVEYGDTLSAPAAPAKEGHTFAGWVDLPETMPANDLTVEGSYTVNTYTITYYVDGEEYQTQSVAYGDTIVLIDEPTKEGCVFSGWSDVPKTMPANDIRVEGTFTVDAIGNVALGGNSVVSVYNMNGVLIKKNVKYQDALRGLPKGLYIINGRKMQVE